MIYEIYEENFEKFEKKLTKIIKKSEKYPECNIHYEVLGDVYKELKGKNIYKFVQVDVSGTVVNDGWRFLATLEHVKEGQNVVRKADTSIEIPEYFNTVKCKCDHCNTNRQRKDTYIVYKEDTGECKQVGRTCLKEYTNGLSAEAVACFESFIHEAENEEYDFNFSTGSHHLYGKIKTVLAYTYPMIKKYGYVPTRDYDGYVNPDSTKNNVRVVWDYFEYGLRTDEFKYLLEDGYDKDDVDYDFIDNALNWIKNCDSNSEYIRNLKAVCSVDYVDLDRNLGLLVSLLQAYNKELTKEEEKKVNNQSEYVREVGSRITFTIKDFKVVTSYQTQFGMIDIYRFVDSDNNVYIWKTSKYFKEEEFVGCELTGTVKAHNEYRDTKQTELTRCKIKFSTEPPKEEGKKEYSYKGSTEEAVDVFYAALGK